MEQKLLSIRMDGRFSKCKKACPGWTSPLCGYYWWCVEIVVTARGEGVQIWMKEMDWIAAGWFESLVYCGTGYGDTLGTGGGL